ncbi:MAG: WD40 repeat domain-containing protein [Gemmatimonadaceae bacterium]
MIRSATSLYAESPDSAHFAPPRRYEGHVNVVSSVLASAEHGLVTASYDGTARLFDTESGRTTRLIRLGQYVWGATLANSGNKLLTIPVLFEPATFELHTGARAGALNVPFSLCMAELRSEQSPFLNYRAASGLAVHPRRDVAFVAYSFDSLLEFDLANGRSAKWLGIPLTTSGRALRPKHVRVSPDGEFLLLWSVEQCVLWDLGYERTVRGFGSAADPGEETDLEPVYTCVVDAAFSPDGRAVYTAIASVVEKWTLSDRSDSASRRFDVDGFVSCLALSPDGGTLPLERRTGS